MIIDHCAGPQGQRGEFAAGGEEGNASLCSKLSDAHHRMSLLARSSSGSSITESI